MGAVSVANVTVGPSFGQYKTVEADVTFSTAYANPTGETVNPKALGLREVKEISTASHHIRTKKPALATGTTSGRSFYLVGTSTAPLIRVFSGGYGVEVANNTNLSAMVVRMRFFGF